MTQMMRYLVLNVLGLAVAVFGLYHASATYPAPNVFDAVGRDLPMLGALASFGSGVLLVIVGLMLLVPWIFRLRKRRMARAVPICSGSSSAAQQHSRGQWEEDFDLEPDDDPYRFSGEDDDYEPRRTGGNGYHTHGGISGVYAPAAAGNDRRERRLLTGTRR